MDARILLTVGLLAAVGLAGCTEGGDAASGTLVFGVTDDSDSPVDFVLDGVYAHSITDTWAQMGNGTTVSVGVGAASTATGSVAAGTYDLLRVVFRSVSADGSELMLQRSGFDLPFTFNVSEGGTTAIDVGFQWELALFEATDGMAFKPALRSVRVTVDGVETVNQDAGELQNANKDVVARMRIFDATGIQAFESDFIAVDPAKPVLAAIGNITLASSKSETLNPGATIDTVRWIVDGDRIFEGKSVEVPIEDLRNVTVTLEVTDSEGVSDSQTVTLAMIPLRVTKTFPFNGDVPLPAPGTGTGVSGCGSGHTEGVNSASFTFEVDTAALPDGSMALGVTQVAMQASASSLIVSDIGANTADGAGSQIHGPSNANFPGNPSYTTNYDPLDPNQAQPASGTWTVKVWGCAAVAATVTGELTITWLAGDSASMGHLLWAAQFDDGHQHVH